MRHLHHIFGGQSQTLDDCLRRAAAEPPGDITIEARGEEVLCPFQPRVVLVAVVTWRFADTSAACRVVCGTVTLGDSAEAAADSLNAANGRLSELIERLQAGAGVVGVGARFDASLLMEHQP